MTRRAQIADVTRTSQRLRWLTRRRTAAACALISCLYAPVSVATTIPSGRFAYRVSWNGIPAATATVDVARDGNGSDALYRVHAAIRTSWLVDWLWRLRARAASSFSAEQLTPLGFLYEREENSKHSVTHVTFDPTTKQAIGTHQRGSRRKILDIHEKDVLDPITAIFRALSQPVRVGDTLRYEVFTGESRYRVELAIAGDEEVTVSAGTFNAWRVEPRVWKIGSGPERRLRQATIWVSQAPVRALVRIRSEVFIGAVNCDLLQMGAVDAGAFVAGR